MEAREQQSGPVGQYKRWEKQNRTSPSQNSTLNTGSLDGTRWEQQQAGGGAKRNNREMGRPGPLWPH
eukprot:1594278-Ditylum_brightwellii.AAC.1